MRTERRPVRAKPLHPSMAAHLQQIPVPPIQLVPHIPPELSSINRTLSAKKSPDDRFQTAKISAPHCQLSIPTSTPPRRNHAPYRISSSTPQPASSTTQPIPPPVPPSTQSFDPSSRDRKKSPGYLHPAPWQSNRHPRRQNRPLPPGPLRKTSREIPSPKDRQTFLRSLPI